MNKKKILVVDDEPNLAEVVKAYLEETGRFEVAIEVRGKRAVATAKKFKPDFIFLDMKMPDMNGFEVMYQFKADPEIQNIPVVFLTGALRKVGPTANPEVDDHILGQYHYLIKPATADELLSCIERFIGK